MVVKVKINNNKILLQSNVTVLKACENLGIEIPRFCYHERLSIAGNCRMCLVEIDKSPKPVVACSMPTMNNMKIFTDTPLVKKARESVLEFLLLNHPLDCPVCDMGGECDLQDQAMVFGNDRSRFYEFKRGVEDKNLGPLVKTIMTRCIHCTRCVRFAVEIAGIGNLGTTARGISTEIGTYIEKVFQSELSGNVIDLCPVGALTSKPYAFIARPWELKTTESIDVSDGICSNIRLDFKENEVMRINPYLNDNINEEWISNKTRFLFDGLKRQRLTRPYLNKNNKFWSLNWKNSLSILSKKMSAVRGFELVGICGAGVDLETQISFKTLFNSLGSENIGFEKDLKIDNSISNNFKSGISISNLDTCDWCLLVGVNTRYEGSILNTRLRKRYLEGGLNIAYIGPVTNFTYPVLHLGLNLMTLKNFEKSKGKKSFLNNLKTAVNPVVIVGSNIFKRFDSSELLKYLSFLLAELGGKNVKFNLLFNEANQAGALELGIKNITRKKLSKAKILYLVGVDNLTSKYLLSNINQKSCFVINQSSNETSITNLSDLVLPSTTFIEREGHYVNIENKVQKTNKILFNTELSRHDWQIFKAFAFFFKIFLNFENLKDIQKKLILFAPSFKIVNFYMGASCLKKNKIFEKPERSSLTNYTPLIEDFYLTNSVTKSSKIMAQCSIFLRNESVNFVNFF